MTDEFQRRVEESLHKTENMGEMSDADAVGASGSPGCGDMIRMWLKFKEENGRRIIDRATFQSFGCETAIAAASLATELVRGKTPEEAASIPGAELAADLGPLPPTRIHCTQLVEDALRSALSGQETRTGPAPESLIGSLQESREERPLVFLDPEAGDGAD